MGKSSGYIVEQLYVGTVRKSRHEHELYGPFGQSGTADFSMDGFVVGFYGRAGDCVDRLGVYTLAPVQQSEFFGGINGLDFDENPDFFSTPAVKIIRIFVSESTNGISVQFEYRLLNNIKQRGEWRGKSNGNVSTIHINNLEVLSGVEGKASQYGIEQLTFIARKQDGGYIEHGPFGKNSDSKPFAVHGYIMGIAGIAGDVLFGLRVYSI